MSQEHHEYVWNLIAKKLSGEASVEELRELEGLLESHPDLYSPVKTISELWDLATPDELQPAETAFDKHLDRMLGMGLDPGFPAETITSPKIVYPLFQNKPKNRVRRIMIASGIAVSLVLGIIFALQDKDLHSSLAPIGNGTKIDSEVSTHNGSKTHLVLPDGTRVWLNAGSRITYDKNYGNTLREVNLTGEAFFDVARNIERPFVIHTARIDIKVLGTRFNVKSYPTDKTTETTLIHGSIEVSIKDRPSEKIILKPNEKLVVANDDSTLHRNAAGRNARNEDQSLVNIRKPTYEPLSGAIVETSWVDNKLIFQDEEFAELAASMERWYGVNIHFANPGLREWRFTGVFQNETIQQALDALKMTANFNYKIAGGEITLYEK